MSFLALIEIARCIIAFHFTSFKIETRSIAYFLSEDKESYREMVEWAIYCICIVDTLSFAYNMIRILDGWIPYFDGFVITTVMIYHGSMLMLSHLARKIHRGK